MNGTIRGEMSERALRLVLEWLSLHRDEIMEAWHKAANGEQPGKIEPLSKVSTMLKITQANYVKDYQIKVVFNDGACRVFDFSPVIAKYPVFKELSDISKFRNYVLTDTLEWNDGEIDIAPEYLYENGATATC